MFKLVQTGINLFKFVQLVKNLFKLVQTCLKLFKRVFLQESDAESFSVVEDPRGPTLKRGTTVTLVLKEEAYDFLEVDTVKSLIKKYSQFINFNIYLWSSKTETVEVAEEAAEAEAESDDEDAAVEEEKEPEITKKVKY